MNKDEIKKAFDICFSAQKSCNGCPLLVLEKQNGRGCKYNLFTSVFDIITEQEEEIDKLKDDYAKLQELFAQYQMASDKEIIAQKKEAEKRFENNMKSVLEIERKQAKIDVLNELKEKCKFDGHTVAVYKNDIDDMIVEVEKCRR